MEVFDSSTWAWSYLKVSYKVFVERLFRGDLDIIEGLLFVNLRPAFASRGKKGLEFLKLFLAEYAKSEVMAYSLGKAFETPADILNAEDDLEFEASFFRILGRRRRTFLRNPYYFNKSFFFFCFF